MKRYIYLGQCSLCAPIIQPVYILSQYEKLLAKTSKFL
jgi:hypothetical protein